MTDLGFNIEQVVDLLGLERADKKAAKSHSFNVKCPLCDNKGFHLNINNDKDNWRCAKCGEGGGMLSLYVLFGMGADKYTRELGSIAIKELKKRLNLEFRRTSYSDVPATNHFEDETVRPDEDLHNVFSALLKIPVLRLSEKHRANLASRGLSEDDIVHNEYRTLPDRIYLPKGKKITYEIFKGEKLDVICKDKPELKRFGQKNIISGLYIGAFLHNIMKLDLRGVPGFFTIDGRWCFKYSSGLLIPVRNEKGQIVNLQIRTDNGRCRYITNSSKGYENGTTGKTRIHFCLSNAKIDSETKVFLTEGPLKADVCRSIMRRLPKYKNTKIAFVAIMGVNATKELSKTIDYIKSCGCCLVFNLLDMDKITNPFVAKAAIKINQLFKTYDINFKSHFWDKNAASDIFHQQMELLKEHQITVKYPNDDVFYKVLYNTLALKSHNIAVPDEIHEWSPKSKGFDDFLKSKEDENDEKNKVAK